jgi:hypothetical protein
VRVGSLILRLLEDDSPLSDGDFEINDLVLPDMINMGGKPYTDADVENADSAYPRIYISGRKDMVYDPPEWMKMGLQQSASGYGGKLNSGYRINFNGKLYRLYISCYSNACSWWFVAKGRTIYVN